MLPYGPLSFLEGSIAFDPCNERSIKEPKACLWPCTNIASLATCWQNKTKYEWNILPHQISRSCINKNLQIGTVLPHCNDMQNEGHCLSWLVLRMERFPLHRMLPRLYRSELEFQALCINRLVIPADTGHFQRPSCIAPWKSSHQETVVPPVPIRSCYLGSTGVSNTTSEESWQSTHLEMRFKIKMCSSNVHTYIVNSVWAK